MNFDPATWGTVADWVGGLGTTAAFVAAVVVIAKDAKVRRLAQARKVVYISEETDTYSLVSVALHDPDDPPARPIRRFILKNLSDEPIYKIYFFYEDRTKRLRYLSRCNVVLPGEEFVYESDDAHMPRVAFRDNSGNGWIRILAGKIYVAANVHGRRHEHLEGHLFKEWATRL